MNNLNMTVYHIPRCAGTTFQHYLLSLYGVGVEVEKYDTSDSNPHLQINELEFTGDLVRDYSSINWDSKTFGYKILLDNESTVNEDVGENIYRYGDVDFDLMYGHFGIDKYPSENRNKVVWLREPLERALSQAKYLAYAQRYYASDLDWPFENMDINDYINSDSVVNTMTKYVGKDLSDFKFVGIVEHMDRDIVRFQDMFGLEKTKLSKTNQYDSMIRVAPIHCDECAKRFDFITADIDKPRFYENNKEDYELYNLYNRQSAEDSISSLV